MTTRCAHSDRSASALKGALGRCAIGFSAAHRAATDGRRAVRPSTLMVRPEHLSHQGEVLLVRIRQGGGLRNSVVFSPVVA